MVDAIVRRCERASAESIHTVHHHGVRVRSREERYLYARAMTWYGYVAHNAPSFGAPDMTVYAVLDPQYLSRSGETQHQLLVVSRPCTPELCDAPPLTLDSFIFSYPMNCSAPLPTPNSAKKVPW